MNPSSVFGSSLSPLWIFFFLTFVLVGCCTAGCWACGGKKITIFLSFLDIKRIENASFRREDYSPLSVPPTSLSADTQSDASLPPCFNYICPVFFFHVDAFTSLRTGPAACEVLPCYQPAPNLCLGDQPLGFLLCKHFLIPVHWFGASQKQN